ncbi:hypothetical protein TWF694_003802 [Orbilia ellipsospora]|uniref:2',3'-cyclic-nucleotide 3'-phosphodiesterase n=1 Tax=Orbilia ellipsospora TaxID=2528407 RepID=A0AAV9WZM0_9PEZI
MGADFQPHITISSGIPLSSDIDYQSLIFSIALLETPPKIQFKKIRYGTAFWTKITLELHKTESLKELAVDCRSHVVPGVDEDIAREWVEQYCTPAEVGIEGFIPHLSLVYWDSEVKAAVRKQVEEEVGKAGITTDEVELEVIGDMGGFQGGKLVFVDTTKKVEEWRDLILAERQL